MNRIFKYTIILLICNNLFCQEKHTLGEVFNQGEKIDNVHIKNLSNGKLTKSSENGFFKIETKIGDSLLFSYVGMKDLFLIINSSNSNNIPIQVNMDYTRIELSEVFLYKPFTINAVSLGIIPKEIKILTQAERRLYTAKNGFLDPVINALSGRTKKLKKILVLEGKLNSFESLKTNYSSYLIEELKLPEELIDMFLNYLVDEDDLQIILNNENKEEVKFYMLNNWLKFKKTDLYIKYSK